MDGCPICVVADKAYRYNYLYYASIVLFLAVIPLTFLDIIPTEPINFPFFIELIAIGTFFLARYRKNLLIAEYEKLLDEEDEHVFIHSAAIVVYRITNHKKHQPEIDKQLTQILDAHPAIENIDDYESSLGITILKAEKPRTGDDLDLGEGDVFLGEIPKGL